MDTNLLVSEINGYRSALNHVFILLRVDIAAKTVISRMFSSFERSCLPREIKTIRLEPFSGSMEPYPSTL